MILNSYNYLYFIYVFDEKSKKSECRAYLTNKLVDNQIFDKDIEIYKDVEILNRNELNKGIATKILFKHENDTNYKNINIFSFDRLYVIYNY